MCARASQTVAIHSDIIVSFTWMHRLNINTFIGDDVVENLHRSITRRHGEQNKNLYYRWRSCDLVHKFFFLSFIKSISVICNYYYRVCLCFFIPAWLACLLQFIKVIFIGTKYMKTLNRHYNWEWRNVIWFERTLFHCIRNWFQTNWTVHKSNENDL